MDNYFDWGCDIFHCFYNEVMLNLPVEIKANNLMFVGLGGGFDIFGAIPLIPPNKNCIFTNYSSKNDFHFRKSTSDDYPEVLLDGKVFSIGRHGVKSVFSAYQQLVSEFGIDGIIAIDGGVDCLMRGDEHNAGTILEDFINLAALADLAVDFKILACIGFGTETEEELNHYRVLENISSLIKNNYFLGSCSLTKQMSCFKKYKEVYLRALGRKSHIQEKVIAAVEGEFGDYQCSADPRLSGDYNKTFFINPLNAIYWFFNLDGVIKQNLLIECIKNSNTFTDAMMLFRRSVKVTRSKEALRL